MSHTLVGRNAVTTDTLGGLFLLAAPQDLPEGASPMNWDVDFNKVGQVVTRPGKQSVYSYGGSSLGPVTGGLAFDLATGGNAWTNPSSILANGSTYASISIASSGTATLAPALGTTSGNGTAWTNPGNINQTGPSNFATVSLTIPLNPVPPGPGPGGNVSSVSPTYGYRGTNVTVTGTGFGTTQGTSYVSFAGVAAPVVSWSSTSIACTVPFGATTGINLVQVIVGGQSGSGANYNVIDTPTGGGGGGGGGACFSGNVRIETRQGYRAFNLLPPTVEIRNQTGVHTADLITHEHWSGTMLDMGGDNLVTLDHCVKIGNEWVPAGLAFPDAPRVQVHDITVYNLHVITQEEADRHYILENGVVAHNILKASLDPVDSQQLIGSGFTFSIPNGATVVGLSVSFNALANGTGFPSIQAQFIQNGVPVGTTHSQNVTTSNGFYTLGSATDLWGANWTSSLVNGSALTVALTAVCTGNYPASNNFSLNSATVTVYYTAASFGDPLQVTEFGFSLPSTSTVHGIQIALSGYTASTAASLNVQLLRNGLPVGSIKNVVMPAAQGTITLGSSADLWGFNWQYSDLNNTAWGVQIKPVGSASQFLNFITATIFQPISVATSLYAKSCRFNNGNINTLMCDANGTIWNENVTSNPGVLNSLFQALVPGTYMKSSTAFNREYMCFSNELGGTDVPRQWDGLLNLDRITQVPPGAPPNFSASLGAGSNASITNFSITSNIVSFVANNNFTAGEIVSISGLTTGTYLNGQTFSVLGTGLTATGFQVAFVHANVGATADAGTATPQYGYPLSSITQSGANPLGQWHQLLWSDAPGSKSAGQVITIYYARSDTNPQPDTTLVNAFNSGQPVYIYVTGAAFGNGVQLVTSVGSAVPPGAQYPRWYLTFGAPTANYQYTGSNPGIPGTYQITAATVTVATPIPNAAPGDQVVISGSTPTGWNATWSVTQNTKSGVYTITQTSISSNTATYNWTLVSGAAPVAGQLVTITGTLNGGGVFNVTDAVIATATGTTSGTFTITNMTVGTVPSQSESGTANSSGTVFVIDPGFKFLGTTTNPIFGNSTSGTITVAGSTSQFPITPGTKQGVCLFVTRNGAITGASVFFTFTVGLTANYIYANQIPIGPPNTIKRIIAFTESGQNGIAGQFFYYIGNPVPSILNNQQVTFSSTVITDNTTTTAKFTFSDAVLVNATEIDIPSQDYFNNIELGSAAWNIPYASRMFYGLVQNKVYNFNNMSFDGGYLPNPVTNTLTPLGWTLDASSNPGAGNPSTITSFQIASNVVTVQASNAFVAGQQITITGLTTGTYLNDLTFTVLAAGLSATQFAVAFAHANVVSTADSGSAIPLQQQGTLLVSPVFGNSYYIKNTTAATQSLFGMITQPAYQDAYGVPIIRPNVLYSVRVTCRCPSGKTQGNLLVDLTDFDPKTGYGITYGKFTANFSSMTSNMAIFTGALLTTPFSGQVSSQLVLRVAAQNIVHYGDLEIDRIEVYPTLQPLGFPTTPVGIIGSYAGFPEQIDINSGVIDLTDNNIQQCYGGAVINNILYLLKENSMHSTKDTPNAEPGNWDVSEVSDEAGACGIHAYDRGEQYLVTACRNGLYAFNGGQPRKISPEIQPMWEAINWAYGFTIWVKNDVINKRILVGVPMATGPGTASFQWLPKAIPNANPTSPNVILVCNYTGLDSFDALVNEPGVHVTMFGALADLEMRRKWTVWTISSPYADFIYRQDGLSRPLFLCNGNGNGKVYQLSFSQLSDDGVVPINGLYVTYGHVNAAKAKENPLLGFTQKRWVKLQLTAGGSGSLKITLLRESLGDPKPWVVLKQPSLTALTTDYVRNLNLRSNRVFVQFETLGLGAAMQVSKLILVGNSDSHSPMPIKPGV
jgi:hypothetical protein